MYYRLAEEQDIDSICNLIKSAIAEMERNNIHQWDEIYPTKEDFLDDIRKRTLYIGTADDSAENPFALKLYRKNGYKETGTAHWRKGTFLLMEKHL